ncbi:MAG: MFS transporter [Spirochaetaceae bacterium]
MNRVKLEKNIYKDYLFTFISRFNLTHGVWMLYLASKGLSLFQIGIMETVYHVSSFTMEIPTGAIADIYGRKISRILSTVCLIISTLIMIYSNSVIFFALSFFFTALSNNLESGAGDALIYDSIKEIGRENEYTKIKGRNELIYQSTQTLALLLGGYIATISYANVYKGAFILACFAFVQALTFTEPTIGKVERSHNFFATFKKQLLDSILVVKKDKRIAEIIILLELFSTFYVTEFFYLQNMLKNAGNTEFVIGIILSIASLATAAIATQTYKIEKKISLKTLVTILPLLAIFGFWGMTFPGVQKISFIILSMIEGVLYITINDYINKLIPSAQRATILSLQSMVFSLFMIILFPIIGKLGDLYGLTTAFIIIAVCSTILLPIMVNIARKRDISK